MDQLVVLGVLSAAPAVMISTLSGLDSVSPVLLKLARVHRLSPARTLWWIVLPAALPRLRSVLSTAAANELRDQMIVEREVVTDLWSTNDFRESLLAWVERREPSYSGT